jgi:hypothetical protein
MNPRGLPTPADFPPPPTGSEAGAARCRSGGPGRGQAASAAAAAKRPVGGDVTQCVLVNGGMQIEVEMGVGGLCGRKLRGWMKADALRYAKSSKMSVPEFLKENGPPANIRAFRKHILDRKIFWSSTVRHFKRFNRLWSTVLVRLGSCGRFQAEAPSPGACRAHGGVPNGGGVPWVMWPFSSPRACCAKGGVPNDRNSAPNSAKTVNRCFPGMYIPNYREI